MPAPQLDEEAIFHVARKIDSPEARRDYLRQVCGANAALCARVQALLQVHEQDRSFLEPPDPGLVTTVVEAPREGSGTVIGAYQLLEPLGEGGMGTVFLAEQKQPVRRKVALKVVKPGMDTRQVVARFEAERQALALMDHPNIARVFDGGETAGGRPYFVMELVRGVPITDYCDQGRLTVRQRLELFLSVCAAVQHAHQKGIIHRDLKPANVLVTLQDRTEVVKVIDFGIAKALDQELTNKTLFTGQAQLVGTPLYMSPEQAGLGGLDVDTRSDIYALGVLLYELLTGMTPVDRERFREAGYEEIRRIIREEEPPPPSVRLRTTRELPAVSAQRGVEPRKLSGLVRGELDWVVLKCLEKDRNRRYETVSALAADVQRYLHDEPVQACPPSAWYRFRKFARRNRTALAVIALVLLFIALLGGGFGWAMRDRAAREARAANELELALERADLFLGQGKRAEALAALDRAELLAGQAPADPARDARRAALKERFAAEEARRAATARDQEFSDQFEQIRLRVQTQIREGLGSFAEAAAFPKIRDALQRWGITLGVTAPVRVAVLVQGRPEKVSRILVAALDECLRWAPKEEEATRQWLLAALAAADNDRWRVQARQAAERQDWKTLAQWVRTVDVSKQPPSFLVLMARRLPASMMSSRLELLRRTQGAHPADLWANYWLAFLLLQNGKAGEAVRYYTAALALQPVSAGLYLDRGRALHAAGEPDAAIADYHRALALAPNFAMAHTNLGNVLYRKGQLDDAIACYRKAIHFKPELPQAHLSLGSALTGKGRLDDAIACFHEAIRLKQDFAEAHYNLGNVLTRKGRLDDAITAHRLAIRLRKDYAYAHNGLGLALLRKGQLDEAIKELGEAIRIKKDFAEPHYNLGTALRTQGAFREANQALRRCLELLPAGAPLRQPAQQELEQCERLLALDARLPLVLDGREKPANAVEQRDLAGLCQNKRRFAAAARFYEAAFAAEPKLADDLGAGDRYNAACCAALAGCGQGKEADKLDGAQRARLRRQGLDWLRADLKAWRRLLDQGPDKVRPVVAAKLRHWLADPDFAGVRGPQALAKLPEAERQAWQNLWTDITDTLARAQGRSTSENKSDAR
jgi:serine/threonine protein kinase/Flp pilus assembly protein TadD